MTKNTFLSATSALALLLLASPSLAQPASTPDVAQRYSLDREKMHEMMQQHHEAMAHDLHTILNIHPDQEAAFTAFQASMTSPPHNGVKGDRMEKRGEMMTMTTPQRLDMMMAHMTERMDHMRKHIEATKTFYAALSPEQQHVFDALGRMHHHGMHGGWGGHGGMHGGHGMGEGPPPPGK